MVDVTKNTIKIPCHQALPAVHSYPTQNAIPQRYPMVNVTPFGAHPHPALPQAPISRGMNIVPKEVN
jgi:hypothetical protein